MQAYEPDRPAKKRRMSVKAQDLEELYLLVQGAPYANTVLDAKAQLVQDDLEATCVLLEAARDRYRQSNKRILRQELGAPEGQSKTAQQQQRRLKQKQDRCKSVLEAFDDLLAGLQRTMRLRTGGKQSSEATAAAPTLEQLFQIGSTFRTQYETARSTRVQLAVIRRYFDVRRVESPHDIEAGGIYFLRGKDLTYLIKVRGDSVQEGPAQEDAAQEDAPQDTQGGTADAAGDETGELKTVSIQLALSGPHIPQMPG